MRAPSASPLGMISIAKGDPPMVMRVCLIGLNLAERSPECQCGRAHRMPTRRMDTMRIGSWTLGVLACALALPALAQQRGADTKYPAKPVRFIVGFAPGGGVDVPARIVAQKLSETFGTVI